MADIMPEELNAFKTLTPDNLGSNLFLTKAELKRMFRSPSYEVMYFLGGITGSGLIEQQQNALKLAKEANGWLFTGIHSETDWTRTKWWAAGWHLANRTGEYAVVVPKYHGPFRLPSRPVAKTTRRVKAGRVGVPAVIPVTPGVQGLQ